MKTLELFESVEDKNGSVNISMEILGNRKHVNINIDYRDINEYTRMSLSDPNNPDLQSWSLMQMAKNNPQIKQQLDDFRALETQGVKQVEAEVLEMVGAFKALVNAMMLEKQHELLSKWNSIVAQHKDTDEYKTALK